MFEGDNNRIRFAVKDDNQFLTTREQIKDINDNPITKMEVLGCSINSCIIQDEEFLYLDSYVKGCGSRNSWLDCYEFRPESFEIKLLSENIPRRITNSLMKDKLIYKKDRLCVTRHNVLNLHSIFYIFCDNEIIFWNWSKEDPIYSVQTEEFYMENSKEKANIRCVGVYELEESAFFLINTETYLILLELAKNSNGNYIINRIRDSFYSLALNRHENLKFSCITVHQSSGRFFLGCENTGDIFEFEFPPLHGARIESKGVGKIIGDKISYFIYDKIQEVSKTFGFSNPNKKPLNSNIYDNQCISKLVCVTRKWLVNRIIPNFLKSMFFGNSEHSVNHIYVDENRGLLYILYKNSDIDVFSIPIGHICIKKISDDFTFIERDQVKSNLTVTSFYPIQFLFRLNFKTIRFELNRLLSNNSNSYSSSGKQSISGGNSQTNSNFSFNSAPDSFFIHSVHPVSPLESESIVLIIVTSKGDRIYMEAKYDTLSNQKEKIGECISFKLPVGLRLKGFRRSPISRTDDSFMCSQNDYLVSSALYSNGVFIQTILNKEESESNMVRDNKTDSFTDCRYTSSIVATCLDQTIIAKNQMQSSSVFCRNGASASTENNNNNSNVFREWQYSFSDQNLGIVLGIQERGIVSGYQRLFDNLWNVPNPYEFKQHEDDLFTEGREACSNSFNKDLFFIRHNVKCLPSDNLTSNNTGFGARTSGSKFYHLWKHFYNRMPPPGGNCSRSSKSDDIKENSNYDLNKLKTFDLIQKELKSNRSSFFLGISFPGSPHSGLRDIVLDQTTQNRSWTVVTTNGVFLLEKKRILDIITKMTLEPHNYSFMLNVFDDYDKYEFSELNRNAENMTNLYQSNDKSVTFVMKLLGTFAHTITFEQFFSVIWQGIINLNKKGMFNSDIFQRIHSSLDGIKGESPLIEAYMRNNDGNNNIINQKGDFPVVNLIKIWITLISDISIQSRSTYSSCCNVKLNSLNCSISVSPRCKGLILLISRILRSIWGIPLFQQTDFEIKSPKLALDGLINDFKDVSIVSPDVKLGEAGFNEYLTKREKNSIACSFFGHLSNDTSNASHGDSKIVNELIKSQIGDLSYEDSGNKRRINSIYTGESAKNTFHFGKKSEINSCSNKGKGVILDISSCIHKFLKPSASDWMSSSRLFSKQGLLGQGSRFDSNKGSNQSDELCSIFIPENNSNEFSRNDVVSVTIKSSLKENHIKHLVSSLTPILNTLNILLPSWFPNHSVNASFNPPPTPFSGDNGEKLSSLGKAGGVGSHSNSCINISELNMFTEIRNFILKAIQVLKVVDLFIKTYPFGVRYNAYVTDENLICITYLDILKKSILDFNLFDLIENKGCQFLIRLLFRYDLLSASNFLNEYCSDTSHLSSSSPKTGTKSTEGILPMDVVSIENSLAQMNKLIVYMKRMSGIKQNFQSYIGSVQPHKANMLSEKVYHVPLNVSLALLNQLEEYRTIMNLISFQSEHLKITGLFPLWLTNGEEVPINIPNSLSEYRDYIPKSNFFIQYFLGILISEIRRSGQQYSSQIVPFSDIVLKVEQSGCKTLLDYCRQNANSNITKSILTYEFHTVLWIYNNLQYLLDLKYNTYVLEIENFLSNIDLFKDEYFEYQSDFKIAKRKRNLIDDSKTGLNYKINSILNNKDTEKSIQEGIDIFNEFREKIMSIKSSITKMIICALKQEDDYGVKSRKPGKKVEILHNEWLHYYLFSYISYTDSCIQRTVHYVIKNGKNRNPRFENWFIKNICITVFLFSESSSFLKNWLENYSISDFYIDRDNSCNFVGALNQSNSATPKNKDNQGNMGLREGNEEKENGLINDQGYLFYNAKQYLSAGKHYYSKAKTFWKIPVKLNGSFEQKMYDYNGSDFDFLSSESILLINSCNPDNKRNLSEYLKDSVVNMRRIIVNTSMLIVQGGETRIRDIYDLFIDILEQIIKVQQEPTLLQRKSLLLQAQTCIERDMNETKNRVLMKSIRGDLFNIETQIEILKQIIEYIHYYILSALEQDFNINPIVKELFELFGTSNNKGFIKSDSNSIMINRTDLESEIVDISKRNNITREGIDLFKYLILGAFNIQSMAHGNDTLLEFMTEFYNLTGFSSITEIKWIIETLRRNNGAGVYNILGNKISALFEFRIKQAYFFETPIFFEMDIVSLLHFCENYVSYGTTKEDSSRFSSQLFDSVIETITLELFRFSVFYYNEFRKNDLVDIYDFSDFRNVKSRVLWWVWPIKFMIFHLNNKSLISRLLPLFSGNSNNSSALSSIIGSNERIELSQTIKDSLRNSESTLL
ncbi:hypothetical protein FG386_000541 [Cryptosporidium ryanae]|uniref:uncharacterized protein n=1 Tax=Cryptosporidium ryanae TaxID=515981 RepID=UPI00351AA710|nr:hypothetical protein FG386_000541 [Cryptosporidium ryanae]